MLPHGRRSCSSANICSSPSGKELEMAWIDAHLHSWDVKRSGYAWLRGFPTLDRTFLPDEVKPELDLAGVTGAVLVQCENSRVDTELMLELKAERPWILGVVGWLDLTRGDAVSEEAEEMESLGAVVGIRHLIHDEPDPDWLLQEAVLAGLSALGRIGLTFDVVSVLPRHLEHVPTIARAAPELSIVIDHLSKPPLATGDLAQWSKLIGAAAAEPNVYAKISGLDTAAPPAWAADDLRPAVERALEAFGPQRLMYGGDWPVCTLAGGYTRWQEACAALVGELSSAEQAAIRHRTAQRFYGLQAAPDASVGQYQSS